MVIMPTTLVPKYNGMIAAALHMISDPVSTMHHGSQLIIPAGCNASVTITSLTDKHVH